MDLSSLSSVLKPLSGVLGGILAGPVGATAAPLIVGTLAKAFGLEEDATPEAVATEINNNPKAPAIVAEVEKQIGKTAQEIEAAMLETVNVTMREEAKSESWGQRWWRPLFGITFNLVWTTHGMVMAWQMSRGDYSLIAQIPNLTVYYGVAGAAVGLYVWKRTEEKMAGVSGAIPGLANVAAAAIKKVVR
jgi:hypothetical protein